MPVSYQFTHEEKPAPLNKLDRWACRRVGEVYSTTQWSTPMFNAIHIVGPRMASLAGRFSGTEAEFDKWKEESIQTFGQEHYNKYYAWHEELLRDLTYRRFTYKCWRGG